MEHRIDVLLVEDDPDSQLLLSTHLTLACGSGISFALESAETLTAALERLKRGRFDVVLLDLMLPDSSGLESVVRLKAAAPDTPIVVLTNMPEEGLGVQAVAAGAQDFLVKDRYDPLLLRRALSYALQRTLSRRLEQVEAEIAERRRVESFKDQVLSTVSHELRSPLTVTKAVIANLQDGFAGALSREQSDLVALAARNLERLARIISNFLDLARLESGKAKVEARRVDPGPLIGEVVEGARLADRQGRLEWRLDVAKVPALRADPDLLVQVLRNLVDNAARYARGRVTVSARPGERGAVLAVEDDGPGIAPEKAPLLFDRFVQLDRKPGGGYKGTGLGLAICQEIARASRGRLWLDRASPGARFCLELPYWDSSARSSRSHEKTEDPHR